LSCSIGSSGGHDEREFPSVDQAEAVYARPQALRRAVIPFHEDLETVRVVDRPSHPDAETCVDQLDAVTLAREPRTLVVIVAFLGISLPHFIVIGFDADELEPAAGAADALLCPC
jgi:hypothetical protein